jgi:tetratricopeptide (TPR) repeat protein
MLAILVMLGQTNDGNSAELSGYKSGLHDGGSEYANGHFAEAARMFSEALAQIPEGNEAERAKILADLGAAYARQEEFAKAEKAYSDSLSLSKRLGNLSNSALMLHNIAMLYSARGRNDDALRYLNQAQELIKSNPKADVRVRAQVLNGLGIINYRNHNNRKAETYFNQVLQTISSPQIHFDRAAILNNLGSVYVDQHKYMQGEETLMQALALKETELGPSHPGLTETLNSLAVLYTQTHRFDEAESSYQRSLKILEPQSENFAPAIAKLLHGLNALYLRAGRTSEAKATLEQAAQIARQNLDKNPEMAAIVDEYSQALKAQGKTREADELHAQVTRARMLTGLVTNVHSGL